MVPVNSFFYRRPRFPIHFPFPLLFVLGARSVSGQCLNLSDTGLYAEFTVPIATESIGVIHLQPVGTVIEVPCSVTHSEGFRAGLLFAFANREQEQMLRALVQAVAHAPTVDS